MPLESPNTMTVYSRDEIRTQYTDDFKLRLPAADVGDGTAPALDAATIADALVPVYQNVIVAGNLALIRQTFGSRLAERAEQLGTSLKPAVGAIGPITITASTGGTTLFVGDVLRYTPTGKRYKILQTRTYFNGDTASVQGLDTGPATNLTPGSLLTFTSPRPGCSPTAVVATGADGLGLKGGSDVEADEQLQNRLVEIQSTPADSGNAAEYTLLAESAEHGVPVEKAWAFPCVLGPGSMGLCFTVLGNGSSRLPNTAQMDAVAAFIQGKMPEDDGLVMIPLAVDPTAAHTALVLRVAWSRQALGWVDSVPFPQFDPGVFTVTAVTDATHFSVACSGTPGPSTPDAGKTIALWDPTARVFVRKRIQSFSGTGTTGTPFALTISIDNTSSDTAYVPVVGQRVGPWSESLNDLAPLIAAAYDALGPGEQTTQLDPGQRQLRTPPGYEGFPPDLSYSGLNAVLTHKRIGSAVVVSGTGLPATQGIVSTLNYLIVLQDVGIYPL